MPTFNVNVKWGKEKFKDVELNTDEDPEVFRAQLFALTSVQPADQKIMCKGSTLKETWEKFPVKNKANLLLMGTASDAKVEEPDDAKIVFVEDLPASAVKNDLPLGLANVGNTCYMNSTLQCFRSTAPVRDAAMRGGAGPLASPLYSQLAALFKDMETATDRKGIDRMTQMFWMRLRSQFPQFAETRNGVPAQQDAGEFWVLLQRLLNESMPYDGPKDGAMTQYFGIDRRVTTTCAEAVDESPEVSTMQDLMLSCHIDREVGYVLAGLKKGMNEELTKNCPSLGRDAPYLKRKEITRLPEYLTVQMVRFYFKREAQENCKIRKDVKFPLALDVFDLCADDLKEKMKPSRDRFNEYQDWEAEQAAALAGKAKSGEKKELQYHPTSFDDDTGSNNSGKYELQAVLTHKGRSADSGHYVSWVKDPNTPNKWYLFDDDKVTVHTDADILKLSGGGDWHTAYMLLYKASACPVIPTAEEAEEAAPAAEAMDTATDN